jgi:branched-chain amino acid transport system ATP-binding protein
LAPALVERLNEALLEINRIGLSILLVEQDVMTAFEISEHAFVVETGSVTMSGLSSFVSEDPRIRQAYMGL